MDTIFKLLLAGGAAFAIYEWFLVPAASAAQASGTPANPAPASTPAPAPTTTKTLVSQAAIAANPGTSPLMLNFDQWNFYYTQVRGVAGPDLTSTFSDRSYKMTIDEWWAAASKAGVSGVGSVGANYLDLRARRRRTA